LPSDRKIKKAIPEVINTRSRFTEDFQQIKKVGKGCFGDVLQCRHRIDGCVYAIKEIRQPVSGQSKELEVLREAHFLAAIAQLPDTCPNIIRYFNVWMEKNQFFVQLEWCASGSLRSQMQQRIESKRPYNEKDILEIALQVAQALLFLHSHGYAHLDVKPDNILEHKGVYKLCDFGLVTKIDDPKSVLMEGDSRYLANDGLQLQELDKVDMFALGMTLYEMALGTSLPSGLELEKIKNGNLEKLGSATHIYPLIRSLLYPEPSHRISAQAAVEEIQNHLDAIMKDAQRGK